MNKQMKDRRRFAKFTSLVLSASLVLGNVMVASAGVNDAEQLFGEVNSDAVIEEAGNEELLQSTTSNNVSGNTLIVEPDSVPWDGGVVKARYLVSGASASGDFYVKVSANITSANEVSKNSVSEGSLSNNGSLQDVYTVSKADLGKKVYVAVSECLAHSVVEKVDLSENASISSATISENAKVDVSVNKATGDVISTSPVEEKDILSINAKISENQDTMSENKWDYEWVVTKPVTTSSNVQLKITAKDENTYYTGSQIVDTKVKIASVNEVEVEDARGTVSTATATVSPNTITVNNPNYDVAEATKDINVTALSVNGKAVTSINTAEWNFTFEKPATVSGDHKLSLKVEPTASNSEYKGGSAVVADVVAVTVDDTRETVSTATATVSPNTITVNNPNYDVAEATKDVNVTALSVNGKAVTSINAAEWNFSFEKPATVSGDHKLSLKVEPTASNNGYKGGSAVVADVVAVTVDDTRETVSTATATVNPSEISVNDLNYNVDDATKDVKVTSLSVNGKAVTSINAAEWNFSFEKPANVSGDHKLSLKVEPTASNNEYKGGSAVVANVLMVTVKRSTTTPTTPPATTLKSQTIKLNKAADKAISFKEGKKGTKTITIKNVKTSLKVTVTKADQKKIKATVQKGNKIKIDSKKKAGTATVKIQAISNTNYKASNTLTVKVTIVPKKKATGKAANVKVVSKTKKAAKVTWKKPAKGKNINGYEVQYASSKKALKNGKSIIVKGAKKKAVTIKKLTSKKKVFVRVRPVYIKNGATNPSKSWSAVKSCKVK